MSGVQTTNKLPENIEKLYDSFLVSLINKDLDLTRLVKGDLIAQISITPLIITPMKKYDTNEYIAETLFAIKVDKSLVSNDKHIELKKGLIRIAYGKIYVEVFGLSLEVDEKKLIKIEKKEEKNEVRQ